MKFELIFFMMLLKKLEKYFPDKFVSFRWVVNDNGDHNDITLRNPYKCKILKAVWSL
jgi:hypothetical protein